jgi:hypothetical protein
MKKTIAALLPLSKNKNPELKTYINQTVFIYSAERYTFREET